MPKGQKERDDFSEKDANFISAWTETGFDLAKRQGCAVEAGLGTGDFARMNGGRVSKALLQNKKLRLALKRHDVNFDVVAKKLKELLEAKSPMNPAANDNFIQHKAVETIIRVMDANPPQKIEVDKNITSQVVITHEAVARMENYKRLRELEKDDSTGVYSERPQEP